MIPGPHQHSVFLGIDDLPDHWVELGGVFTKVNPTAVVTRIPVVYTPVLTEGVIASVHTENDSTSYQNTTGNTAIASLVIGAISTGLESRHVKIWSSPNDNSSIGATLLFEIGTTSSFAFDNDGDEISLIDLKIQHNHYLVIENVDEGRAGTNNIAVNRQEYFFVKEYTGI